MATAAATHAPRDLVRTSTATMASAASANQARRSQGRSSTQATARRPAHETGDRAFESGARSFESGGRRPEARARARG